MIYQNELLYALDDIVDDMLTAPETAYKNAGFETETIQHLCSLAYDEQKENLTEALNRSNQSLGILKLAFRQSHLYGFARLAHVQIEKNNLALAADITPAPTTEAEGV